MAYVCSAYPEDYVFGDICRVVGHALQVPGHDQRVQQVTVHAGGFAHRRIHGFKNLPVHVVHQVVALQHRLRQVDVGGQEGVERVADHADAHLRHAWNVDVQPGIGAHDQIHNALGDVHRLVAHALQVGIDLDARNDKTQVDGHGLLHGQQVNRHLVHVALGGIDL